MNVPNVRRQEVPPRKCYRLCLCGDAKADSTSQVDVSEDGFLSLMSDDGSTKDDVKLPDGEVGDKINKLFTEEGKDTSKFTSRTVASTRPSLTS